MKRKKKKHEKLRKEKTNPKPKKKKKNSRIFSGVYQKTIPADTPSYGPRKVPRKRNQLLIVLLKNKPLMENQVLFQISILRTKQPK